MDQADGQQKLAGGDLWTCARLGEGSLGARSGPHLAFLHIQPDTHVFIQPDMQNKTHVNIQQYIFQPDMLQHMFFYSDITMQTT